MMNGLPKGLIQIYLGRMIYFNERNPGSQGDSATEVNHRPCINEGIIAKYRNDTFTEYVMTRDTNEYVTTDEGDKLLNSVGELVAPTKLEIVYVKR